MKRKNRDRIKGIFLIIGIIAAAVVLHLLGTYFRAVVIHSLWG